jgi:hypothetical protein
MVHCGRKSKIDKLNYRLNSVEFSAITSGMITINEIYE